MSVLPVGIGSEEAGGGYQIPNSLRFNSADSAYLSRTVGSGGSTTTWTISLWFKRSKIGANQMLWSAYYSGNVFYAEIPSTDILRIRGGTIEYQSSQVFRDPSAWYHLVFSWDSTNATAGDKMRVYLNGDEINSWSTETHAGSSENGYWNQAGATINIGRYANYAIEYFDGYITEFNFVDGSALTASDFGEFNTNTGVWQPKEYTGSYGTNGFYLPFTENDAFFSATTGGKYTTTSNNSIYRAIGNDSAGVLSGVIISGDFDIYWRYGTASGGLSPTDSYEVGVIAASYKDSFNYNTGNLGGTASTMFLTRYGSAGFSTRADVNGSNTDALTSGTNPSTTSYVRISRSGSTVSVHQGTTPGTWTLIKTFTGTSSADMMWFFGSGNKNENISLNDITFNSINGVSTIDLINLSGVGSDNSGNGNNWFPQNISSIEGAGNDSLVDTPTPYGTDTQVGGEVRGNYATWNPLDKDDGITSVTQGNLTVVTNGSNGSIKSTIAFPSGKWYWEVTSDSVSGSGTQAIGIMPQSQPPTNNMSDSGKLGYAIDASFSDRKFENGTATSYGSYTQGNGVVYMLAFDQDAGKLWYGVNGTWLASGNPATGSNPSSSSISTSTAYCAAVSDNTVSGTFTVNFGQRPFEFAAPSGFKALCTTNLPEPDIVDGEQYMEVYTYTGNGGGLQVGEVSHPYSAYNLDQSLRFDSTGPAYLSRTFGSGGSTTTWTWSTWVKRGNYVNNPQRLFYTGNSNNNETDIYFSNDRVVFEYYVEPTNYYLISSKKLRDPSAWYHLVVVADTTNSTQSDRIRIYVNGSRIDTFDNTSYPGTSGFTLNSAATHYIGQRSNGTNAFDGYMAEINFVDGQALTASDFGQYDGNNFWVPKSYTGSYGTNGYYLDFSDTSTTAALGTDSSGNGNNWSTSGFSVTTDSDSFVDVPTSSGTDTGLGGEVKSNYATLNPLKNTSVTLSNGNLQATYASASWVSVQATMPIPKTGKWKYEVTPTTMTYGFLALVKPSSALTGTSYNDANNYCWYLDSGEIRYSGSNQTIVSVASVGDTCEVRVDNGEVSFYRNGALQHTFTQLMTSISDDYFPAAYLQSGAVHHYNFGQRPFSQAAPGYQCLCTANIPEDTTDLETPDLVWIKNRSASASHTLFDVLRGTTKYLKPDDTPGDTTDVNSLLQFNKNGFLLGSSSAVNTSGNNYAAWAWKANGSGTSIAAGSIDGTNPTIASTVSANPTSGFSIVTYTSPNSSSDQTVGHGLGVEPSLIIVKNRTGFNWDIYHKSLGYNASLTFTTSGTRSGAFGSTINGSVFTTKDNYTHYSTNPYVAYCFTPVEGFSAFGSYQGNASDDGPYIYLGFRPRWLMIKCSTLSGSTFTSWSIFDTSRSPYNVSAGNTLYANSSILEGYRGNGSTASTTSPAIDLLSNGFKLRKNADETNAAQTYIYAAFAENPFKYALAR